MNRPLRGLLALTLTLTAAAGLSACRNDETGRPITFEKGTYQGKKDTPLDADTVKRLRERTAGQNYSGI